MSESSLAAACGPRGAFEEFGLKGQGLRISGRGFDFESLISNNRLSFLTFEQALHRVLGSSGSPPHLTDSDFPHPRQTDPSGFLVFFNFMVLSIPAVLRGTFFPMLLLSEGMAVLDLRWPASSCRSGSRLDVGMSMARAAEPKDCSRGDSLFLCCLNHRTSQASNGWFCSRCELLTYFRSCCTVFSAHGAPSSTYQMQSFRIQRRQLRLDEASCCCWG